MERKKEEERAGRKGGKAESHKEHEKAGRSGGRKASELHEGRKHYDEARGKKSGEATARKAPHAKVAGTEARKERGHLGGKGEMTKEARMVEGKHKRVEVHHYHHRGEKK
jgi:hypothetical protein